MRISTLLPALLAAGACACACAPPAAAQAAGPGDVPSTVRLESPRVELAVSPRLGGRILHFSAAGAPNLLRTGEAVRSQPDPAVDAGAPTISYLGHEVWVGPQSAWWLDQALNPARRKAAAQWPPDPWLAHAPAGVLEQGDDRLVLQGAASPVSGVQLTQFFAIAPDRTDTVELAVEMRNVRPRPVSHDIWFNTRVAPETRVFVPVAADGSGVRVRSDPGEGFDGLVSSHDGALFSLELLPPGAGLQGRRGKVFIQPRAGWIAGFTAGQAFVIHFELQALDRIHPEQGQVELYLAWRPGDADTGVLELEVHAPYVTLAPGESATAQEWWVVRRYDGPDRRDAQLAFLERMLAEAGIE